MKDYLTLGPTPAGEDCAQVGASDYYERAKEECRRYKNQLIEQFGPPPIGARFITKSFPHDFGNYYEVCIEYEDTCDKAIDYAFNVESNIPENWK